MSCNQWFNHHISWNSICLSYQFSRRLNATNTRVKRSMNTVYLSWYNWWQAQDRSSAWVYREYCRPREPKGRYHYSTMFHWEPEGHYCHWLCTAIAPFWFSMKHQWIVIRPCNLALNWCVLYQNNNRFLIRIEKVQDLKHNYPIVLFPVVWVKSQIIFVLNLIG